MVKRVKKAEKGLYTATIKVLGRTYSSTGETAKEAVQALKPTGTPKGLSILTLSKGDKQRELILNSSQTFRLFTPSRLVSEITLKNTLLRIGL